MTQPAARIRVTLPDGGGQEIEIDRAMTLGRHPDCEICVDEPSISKRHCTFSVAPDGQLSVSNRSATNPMKVNHVKADECRLREGDVINVGLCRIVVVSTASSEGEDLAATMAANDGIDPTMAVGDQTDDIGPASLAPEPPAQMVPPPREAPTAEPPPVTPPPPASPGPASAPDPDGGSADRTSVQSSSQSAEVQARARQLYAAPVPGAEPEKPPASVEDMRTMKIRIALIAGIVILGGAGVIMFLPEGETNAGVASADLPPRLERDDVESAGAATASDEIKAARDLLSQANSREENAYRALQACGRAEAKSAGTAEAATIAAEVEQVRDEAEAFIDQRFNELEIEYKKNTNLGDEAKAQEVARRMMELVGDPSDKRYLKAKDYLGRSR